VHPHWLKRLRKREYADMIVAGEFEWLDRFGAVELLELSSNGFH